MSDSARASRKIRSRAMEKEEKEKKRANVGLECWTDGIHLSRAAMGRVSLLGKP